MYKRMLVPVDGSPLAKVIIEYARKLVSIIGLEVVILKVLAPEDKTLLPMNQAYIDRAAERIACGGFGDELKCRGELVIDRSPVEAIKKSARKNNVDFILMATHGRSGFSRLVIGSVADALLRKSQIPIWLIHTGIPKERMMDPSSGSQIMLLLDGSKRAESSIPHVEKLAKQFGVDVTEVVLVRVCEEPEIISDYPPNMPLSWEDYVATEKDKCKHDSKNYLEEIIGNLRDKGINARYEILMGEPTAEIIGYAQQSNFRLIVMATHARSGFSRWAYGSVAEIVIKGATVPVFLVRNKQVI